MKYIFIFNPAVGGGTNSDKIKKEIEDCSVKIDYEIYKTKGHRDATRFVKEWCDTHSVDEEVCFVACGGDGSVNEVVNGVANYKNASFSVYACGSGNDFVKYFGDKNRFLSIEKLVKGQKKSIDLIKVNDYFCINVCHFGLDSFVAKTANEVKEKGGKNPYGVGVRKAILKGRKNKHQVYVDNEKITKDRMLLCTLANGGYVGGKYHCAPKAIVDDGYLEVCLVHPCSIIKLISLIGKYKNGEHLDNKKFKKLVVYRRAKHVEIIDEKEFDVSIDGEMISSSKFVVDLIPKGISMIIPEE